MRFSRGRLLRYGSVMKLAAGLRRFLDSRWVKSLESLLLGLIALVIFGANIQDVRFHPDESQWIASSSTFEAFIRVDFSSSAWDDSYWTRTLQPLSPYVIGLGRQLGGHGVVDLNVPWRFGIGDEANIARGAMPGPSLLWWSRFPMAILGALSGVMLFALVSAAAGRAAGYASFFLFVSNSYLLTTLRRAMAEAPLLAAVLLAVLVGNRALRSWDRATLGSHRLFKVLYRPLLWFTAMGMLSGVAGSAKLNGLAVAVAAGVLCLVAPLSRVGDIPKNMYALAITACTAAFVGAGMAFVLINPYLYPDPLTRTGTIFVQRYRVMSSQIATYPDDHISGIYPRVAVVLQRVFEDFASLSFQSAEPINVLLCILGIVFITRRAFGWLRRQDGSPASMVFLAIGFFTVSPSLLTPLDWSRYYLLPVVFSTACIGAGIAWTIQVLYRNLLSRYVRAGVHDGA